MTKTKNESYIAGFFPSFFNKWRVHKKDKIAPVKIKIAYHLISRLPIRIAVLRSGRKLIPARNIKTPHFIYIILPHLMFLINIKKIKDCSFIFLVLL